MRRFSNTLLSGSRANSSANAFPSLFSCAKRGTATASLFTGFPRHSAHHPFSAAPNANATVSTATLDNAIKKVMATPQHRTQLCLKALSMVRGDATYKAALEWERKALRKAERHPFVVLWGVFAALFAQNGIMMYWVFIAFDWNLVEPCTYFFGYTSVTWFALVFYKYTGREFTYDAMIEEMKRRKFNQLCNKQAHYVSVLADFRHKEEVLRQELEGLGVNVEELFPTHTQTH